MALGALQVLKPLVRSADPFEVLLYETENAIRDEAMDRMSRFENSEEIEI